MPISTTGPLFCYRADLSQSEGSSALLAATSSDAYATKEEMGKACCGMTDYYVLTGNVFAKPSTFFADASTCDVAAHPTNGAYASAACAPGSTLYSGNGCHVECDDGFTAAGVTRCVKGAFVEYATCESDDVPAPTPTEPVPVPAPTEPAAETCEDSTSWYYKKTKKTCAEYVAKKVKYCKEKYTSDDGVTSLEACPVTCKAGCACEDSTTWWTKKSKNTCAEYVAKKSKYCKKKVTSDDGVTSLEACPATCGSSCSG